MGRNLTHPSRKNYTKFEEWVCSQQIFSKRVSSYFFKICCGEVASFNSNVTQHSFLIGFLQDILLNCTLTDQSVDVDISRLANTVTPVLCLSIHCWIPVTVIKYDCISTSEIYSKATTACGQDEAEDSWICIETLHQDLTWRTNIQNQM